jgi:tetratricopeptide (TPR) repeat protein
MPGELALPGPVDPSQTGGILTASPLYGLREWRSGERELLDSTGPKGPVEIAAIERMRSELMTTDAVDAQGQPLTDGAGQTGSGALTGPALNQSMTLQPPIESPRPMQLTTDPLDAVLGSKKLPAQPGNVDTQQSLRQRILAPPERQSTQVAELRKRYAQYAAALPKEQTDQEANVDFQRGWRAKQAREQAQGALLKEPLPPVARDDQKTPPQQPGAQAMPPAPAGEGEAQAPVEKPQPLNINNLAEGVKAKGLNELLTSAEQLAKQGKYSSAVAQYERAEQVAPNNPLIWIGRANAELGAGFFLRAEQNLRAAFRADPSLLVGKYDLKTFLGEERVKELVKDLTETADDEPTQTRPLFLLAWVAYNTGEERKAAAYLDLAEKRSNGRDGIYKLLRDTWTLPTKDENK